MQIVYAGVAFTFARGDGDPCIRYSRSRQAIDIYAHKNLLLDDSDRVYSSIWNTHGLLHISARLSQFVASLFE